MNPKLGESCDSVDAWYPYYAGYSASFVEGALAVVAKDAERVLDPWNGTGTTTVVAAGQNVAAIGFDINPALVVVSKARLLGAGVWASIDPLADDVVGHAADASMADDPLHFWFAPDAAACIRGLQQSIHRVLVDSGAVSQPAYERAASMSTLAAFFYTALFRTVRLLIAPKAGSNPTWWKRVSDTERLHPPASAVLNQFRASVSELRKGLHRKNFVSAVDVDTRLCDSRRLELDDDAVDAAVTSPPYCTRVDYGIATRPELAVLGAGETDLRELRDRMVGTPTMTGEHGSRDLWGATAQAFLERVEAHDSKASRTYYANYFKQYYAGMWESLGELRRVLRDDAPAVVVVQDNHYKDVHNDIARILSEMAASRGFGSVQRHDFPVKRNRAAMNPRTQRYRERADATESVLVLR